LAVRRVRLFLSVLGIVLTIAATMLAGEAAMTARHPGFTRSLDPQTAGFRWFAVEPAAGRRWAQVVEPVGRRW
jgi:hypothetical protein